MNGTHHKGLRVILLLTILFVNLGLDHAQMVYAAAPTNDNFANAKLINSITYTDLNVNTAEATPRYNPVTKALVAPGDNADPDNVGPCEDNFYFNIASNTVWYTYTPQVTESISVDTNGSDYDTFVAVWTGSPPNLNLVGCNDDNYLGDSELSFTANAGTAYHIQVGEFNGYYDPNPANEDLGGNSGGTLQFHAFITNVEVTIGGDVKGRYYMESGDSTVESYPGVNGGPVVIKSINGEKIIASLLQYRRPAYTGGWTGITQTMAVTNTQISNKYVFPHYDYTDPTRYNSLQLANYDTIDTNIIVEIGGVQRGKFPIAVGSSQNVTFSGVIGGPVVVYSENDADIIVSLYELKKPITSSKWTGQTQMMGLPWTQLSDTYIIPRYNYTLQDVIPYIVFANADTVSRSITITIGNAPPKGPYTLAKGQSMIQSYPGVNGGPVVIKSAPGAKIIASLLQYRRPAYTGGWTGITQTMAVTNAQISNKYVFPHYDYTDPTRYNSLQLANYDTIDTNIIVEIGGVQRGKFPIAVGSSQNVTFSGVIGGPVVVYSENEADIIVSLYELKKPNTSSKWTGQSQMMGLPWAQLSDTYIIPRYNYTLQDVVPYVIFAAP